MRTSRNFAFKTSTYNKEIACTAYHKRYINSTLCHGLLLSEKVCVRDISSILQNLVILRMRDDVWKIYNWCMADWAKVKCIHYVDEINNTVMRCRVLQLHCLEIPKCRLTGSSTRPEFYSPKHTSVIRLSLSNVVCVTCKCLWLCVSKRIELFGDCICLWLWVCKRHRIVSRFAFHECCWLLLSVITVLI